MNMTGNRNAHRRRRTQVRASAGKGVARADARRADGGVAAEERFPARGRPSVQIAQRADAAMGWRDRLQGAGDRAAHAACLQLERAGARERGHVHADAGSRAARCCAWSRQGSRRAARTIVTSRAPITAGRNSSAISTRCWRSCDEAGLPLSLVCSSCCTGCSRSTSSRPGRRLPHHRADGQYRSREEARAAVPHVVRHGHRRRDAAAARGSPPHREASGGDDGPCGARSRGALCTLRLLCAHRAAGGDGADDRDPRRAQPQRLPGDGEPLPADFSAYPSFTAHAGDCGAACRRSS